MITALVSTRRDYYVPVYDPEQVARWEQIINKCPIIDKNSRFFILKSIDEESLRVS